MKSFVYAAPHQSVFLITTNYEDLENLMRLKYGKYILSGLTDKRVDFYLEVCKNVNNYQIATGTKIINTSDPIVEIDRFIFQNNKFDTKIFAIHGAAIEYKGKAFLLIAPTTGGKTTLTGYLLSRGMGYITEDCILMDRASFHIHPFTLPLQIREDGMNVLIQNNVRLHQIQQLHIGSLQRYIYDPIDCVHSTLPLGGMFFIERSDENNLLSDMTKYDSISALLRSPMISYDLSSDYLHFIAKLSQHRCGLLQYRDMDFVYKTIQSEYDK